MRILLLSTYELGHQPLGLARPAADLTAAGHDVACQDLAIDHLDDALVRAAGLVGISVPMHTATRLGARLAERIRAINPAAHVAFYGLYAGLHADVLIGHLADSVVGGEFEGPLVALADALAAGGTLPAIGGIQMAAHDGGVFLGRQAFSLPRRDLLPPLERYAHLDTGERRKPAGYVEASRGCAHRCLHCPITPVYGGRLRIIGQDAVLDDISQLVEIGAEHITFGDPDFFNGIRHSLRIVEALHAAHPHVTFDATIKVEHILEHRQHVPTLAQNGCLFVVSAVEAVQDHILANFNKGHSAADVVEALRIMAASDIPLRPTFVPFTPWTTADDYLGLLRFVARHGLIRHVDPIQLAIRLLVPRGSSLVGTPAMAPHLGPFDPDTFSYRWAHPDPRMDALQETVAARAEAAIRDDEDAVETFWAIAALAEAAVGTSAPAGGTDAQPEGASTQTDPSQAEPVGASARTLASLYNPLLAAAAALAFVPRLTESWFC